jgi:hypothetical protein
LWVEGILSSAAGSGGGLVGAGARRGRVKKKFWKVGFILNELKRGRPAYMGKEELDAKSPKALELPRGAVVAVGTLFFLALSAHFTR